jgi:hypothetical protein
VFEYISEIIGEADKSYQYIDDPKERLVSFIEAIFKGMTVPEYKKFISSILMSWFNQQQELY